MLITAFKCIHFVVLTFTKLFCYHCSNFIFQQAQLFVPDASTAKLFCTTSIFDMLQICQSKICGLTDIFTRCGISLSQAQKRKCLFCTIANCYFSFKLLLLLYFAKLNNQTYRVTAFYASYISF